MNEGETFDALEYIRGLATLDEEAHRDIVNRCLTLLGEMELDHD